MHIHLQSRYENLLMDCNFLSKIPMCRILHRLIQKSKLYLPMPCARNMHVIIDPKFMLTFWSIYLIWVQKRAKCIRLYIYHKLMCTHCQMDKKLVCIKMWLPPALCWFLAAEWRVNGSSRRWKTCRQAHLSPGLEVTPLCISPTTKQIMHPSGLFHSFK